MKSGEDTWNKQNDTSSYMQSPKVHPCPPLSSLLMQLYTNTGNWLEPTPPLVKEPGATHREPQAHTLALRAPTLALLRFALDPVSRTYVAFFDLSAHATSVLACKKKNSNISCVLLIDVVSPNANPQPHRCASMDEKESVYAGERVCVCRRKSLDE